MKIDRGGGILLHITSLPSAYGIGDLGPGAFQFVDLLAKAKQKYWQILPLNPTEALFQHSPYSSPSAFALNPLLISPALLVDDDLITAEEAAFEQGLSEDEIDFDAVQTHKNKILRLAFKRWQKQNENYESFCEQQKSWLADYALFMALKDQHEDVSWVDWPAPLRDREPNSLAGAEKELRDEITYYKFLQFLLHQQWSALKTRCAEKGVQIIGDVPIYVEHGSVDVWRQPGLFKLDKDKRPTVVAGVPPDYFSETGQRWGNPIFNWQAMQEEQFNWWAARLARNLSLFDIVRIDHFRGLVAFWQVPASEKTAVKGDWIKAPTYPLFERLMQVCPQLNVIAEDLGLITDDVIEARERLKLPGMKVLQFAFDADLNNNAFLPHNYPENCIVYTGTHDNNTSIGWYRCDATDHEKWQVGAYVKHEVTEENVHWTFIDLALKSRANAAIIPLQDVLGLDETARMNTPGTAGGNWKWRVRKSQLAQFDVARLEGLIRQSGRG